MTDVKAAVKPCHDFSANGMADSTYATTLTACSALQNGPQSQIDA